MRKTKFRFNPETLEYEKVSNTLLTQIARVFGFVSLVVTIGIISFLIVNKGQNTEALENQLADYEVQIRLLEKKSMDMQSKLDDLSSMDDNVYREIFGADPINEDIRKAGTGGIDKYTSLDQLKDGEKIKNFTNGWTIWITNPRSKLNHMETSSKWLKTKVRCLHLFLLYNLYPTKI